MGAKTHMVCQVLIHQRTVQIGTAFCDSERKIHDPRVSLIVISLLNKLLFKNAKFSNILAKKVYTDNSSACSPASAEFVLITTQFFKSFFM